MHDSLLVGEIVDHIIGFLDPSLDRASLVALATTCRALSEPALDHLWKEAGDKHLLGLINLMPSDVWGWQSKDNYMGIPWKTLVAVSFLPTRLKQC
jgi:hypothetical protein